MVAQLNSDNLTHLVDAPDTRVARSLDVLVDPVWEAQPGEPHLWFSRFHLYLLIVPERRSISEAFRVATNSPVMDSATADWYEISRRWRWHDRALAYDNEQARILRAKVETLRLENKIKRIEMLEQVHDTIMRQLPELEYSEFNWRVAPAAIKVVLEQQRAEFDDEPKQRHELTGANGGPIQQQTHQIQLQWNFGSDDSNDN